MKAKFGPAGNPEIFYEQGNKSSLQMPAWLKNVGLDLYEYQCSKGVKISDDSAQKLGSLAKENGIELSIHSPYYSNLATDDPEKQVKTINYIRQTLNAASHMDAKRIVVHMGAPCKLTRVDAMNLSKALLIRIIDMMKTEGFYGIHLCLEIMGKINQLGTLDEVLKLCLLDDNFLPCVDFGHVNSRTLGSLTNEATFSEILDKIENKLGYERMCNMHCHFSKIEYTKMGEKKHLTFADTQYGPDFLPLAKVIVKRNIAPHIICESAGTQSKDALIMKKMVASQINKEKKQ